MNLFRALCQGVLAVDTTVDISWARVDNATHCDATATNILFDETVEPEGKETDDICKPPTVSMICTKSVCTCCKDKAQ